MLTRDSLRLEKEFSATLSSLDDLRQSVREALTRTEMPTKRGEHIVLAVEEAASNIIRHAYRDWSGTFLVRVEANARRVVVSLRDFGRPYAPDNDVDVSFARLAATARKGGLGQLMMQKLMDDVEYIIGDGFNELRLTKYTRPRWVRAATLPYRAFTLRARFTLATTGLLLIIVLSSYYAMESRVARGIEERLHSSMSAIATTCASLAGAYILNNRSWVEFDELAYGYTRRTPQIERLTITDTLGLILADSKDVRLLRQAYESESRAGGIDHDAISSPLRIRDSAGAGFFYRQAPIETPTRGLGIVHLVYTDGDIAREVSSARKHVATLMGALLLVGLVGVYFMSNYFVRPILAITDRVRRWTDTGAVAEESIDGAPEFREIARGLNHLMTRLRRDTVRKVEEELLVREVEMASQVQTALLPQSLPETPGLEIGAFYKAASFVGGDLYDVFPIGSGRLCLAIADVSGKGVPASLIMSMTRTAIRLTAPGKASALDILREVEDHITQDTPRGVFITLVLAVFDTVSRELSVVSAGHHPLIHYTAREDRWRMVNPRGAPLGVRGIRGEEFERVYAEERFTLADGDLISFYTDGLIDAMGADGQRVGADLLADMLVGAERECVAANSVGASDSIVRSVIQQVEARRDLSLPGDDMTLIVARVTRAPRAA